MLGHTEVLDPDHQIKWQAATGFVDLNRDQISHQPGYRIPKKHACCEG